MVKHAFSKLGLAVLKTESEAIIALTDRLDDSFDSACDLILNCEGRVVVTGMGKSGHIGNKIAATLASTGTPAFFMHPGEASHGDLGMITAEDMVIALSNSGETSEITLLLPLLKRLGIPLISLTGKSNSTLGARGGLQPRRQCQQRSLPHWDWRLLRARQRRWQWAMH